MRYQTSISFNSCLDKSSDYTLAVPWQVGDKKTNSIWILDTARAGREAQPKRVEQASAALKTTRIPV